MSKENTWSHRGIKLSENPYPDKLRARYGIIFERKVHAARLGLRNRLVLPFKRGIRNPFVKREFYDPNYNMYLFKRTTSPETHFHENTHGFEKQKNPGLFSASVGPEKRAINKVIVEGLARFVERDYFGSRVEFAGQKADDLYNKFSKYLDRYKFNVAKGRKLHIKAAWRNIENLSYNVGYYFVNSVIRQYAKSKEKVGKVLEKIIVHPPGSFAELRDPQAYFRRIAGNEA